VREAKKRMGYREYLGWLEFLDREVRSPWRATDLYLVSLAREVRQKLSSRVVPFKEMLLRHEEPITEVRVAELTRHAKNVALGRLQGMQVTEVRVRRSELGS